MAYTTIQDVRAYADIDSTTDDDVIRDIITAAQKSIDTYCGRTFEAAADSTRYYDAVRDTDGLSLYFEDADIAQITTVTNGDTVEVTSSEYTTLPRNNTPYYGIKILTSASKTWEFDSNDDPEGAISILGRWAFSVTAPDDIQHACKELATFLYRRREMPTADVTAVEAGLVVRPFSIPPTVRALLDPYRRLT